MFIPAVIIIEKLGIKMALIIGLISSIAGSALALFVDAAAAESIGQLIVDAGYPLIFSCGTMIPAKWFPFRERFLATSFCVLSGLIGYAMGDASQAAFGSGNRTAFALTLTITGFAALMLTVLLFKNAPDMPPSISEAKKRELEGFDLKEELQTLLHDSGFVLAAISSALFLAYLNDIQHGLTNIIQLGDPDIKDINGITLFYYVPGAFSVMLPALYFSKGIMLYRSAYCVINIISFVTLGVLVIAIAYARDSMYFLYTSTAFCGFATIAC